MLGQRDLIKDLLGSDLRKQIYETILLRSGEFSVRDLVDDLNKKGIITTQNTTQQFLQALVRRKILHTHSIFQEPKRAKSITSISSRLNRIRSSAGSS